MDSMNQSIDLDSSSVLSSTKNDPDSSLLTEDGSRLSGSSDTEGPEEITNEEYVTSLQSPDKDAGKYIPSPDNTFEQQPANNTAQDTTAEESVTDQSSVSRASQLLSSTDNTIRDSSTASALAAEVSAHQLRVTEEIVEGVGESLTELQEKSKPEKSETESLSSMSKRPYGAFVESQDSSGEISDVENSAGQQETLHHTPQSKPGPEEMMSKKARIAEPDLPDTVKVLYSQQSGAKVYLIGTAHFSKESCDDVSRIIVATQPDIVMVELCKQRTNILHLDEDTILEEAQNLSLERSLEILRQQGTLQGVMYLLLLSMSAHITKELGMAPGGEFRRAYLEAQKVPRCMVHLGDRPIGITLQRALSGLTMWQKVKLGFNILTSKDTITKEEVEKCKQRDLLENMLAEMAGEFPALSRVFVSERDLFLAHSLQMSADSMPPCGSGSPPSRVVVGVVGIGHVPGIIANWGKVSKEQIREVVKIEPASRIETVAKFAVKAIFLGSCCFGMYKLAKIPVSRFLLAR